MSVFTCWQLRWEKTVLRLSIKTPVELAAEFGNYIDIKPIRIASVIRNFAKKFGYELKNVGRESTGKRHRTYEIKVMADIERYAANRIGIGELKRCPLVTFYY